MSEGRYTRIKSKFWTDEKARTWDSDTQLLALYLLTSPHKNILGCYILPNLYICADLGWDLKQLGKPFSKLLAEGFIKYDEKNELILLTNFLRHNPIENGNQVKAALNALKELPQSPLMLDLKGLVEQLGKPFLKPLAEQLGKQVTVTVTVTVENNICEPSSEIGLFGEPNAPAEKSSEINADDGAQVGDNADSGKGSGYTSDYELFWSSYPRHKEKQTAFRCWKARLKEGAQPREMIDAARLYAQEVRRLKTQEEFIKQPKTFIGPNRPYLDYIRKVVSISDRYRDDDYTG